MTRCIAVFVAFGLCIALPIQAWAQTEDPVKTGLEVLKTQQFDLLHGRSVGLIMNHTSVDASGRSLLDLLRQNRRVDVAAVFTPEHGLFGNLDQRFGHSTHPRYNIPVYSLYGDTLEPQDWQLAGVEALVFDIQDLGTRADTYLGTLAWSMQAAARNELPFVVLDRPNLIGAELIGGGIPLMADCNHPKSIYPIPTQHGMTIGELARLFNKEYHVGANLYVVPMENYDRAMTFEDTGLRWISPSPNITSQTTAFLYVGLGLLEGTNLSVGRGTETPFELFGAPWVDARRWLELLEDREAELAGVSVEQAVFTPNDSAYAGQECQGIRIEITDFEVYDGFYVAIELMQALLAVHPDLFDVQGTASLAGDRTFPDALNGFEDPLSILTRWDTVAEELFAPVRDLYMLY